MKFQSSSQRDCYLKILPWMEDTFGDSLLLAREQPEFGVAVGSALAQTVVQPFGDDCLICTRAYVVQGVDKTYELLDYLLQLNDKTLFGAFGLDSAGNVFFQHSLLGSTCDPPELESSITAVVAIADRYDDEIVSRWGGVRAIDRARPWSEA